MSTVYRITLSNLPERNDLFLGIQEILRFWNKQGTPLELSGRYKFPHLNKLEPEINVRWSVKQTKTYLRIYVEGPKSPAVIVEAEQATDGL